MPKLGTLTSALDRHLVNALRLGWVAVILWYEVGTFLHTIAACSWPDTQLSSSVNARTHVLLLADPQILGSRSYPGRSAWLTWLSRVIVDLNMRKSWWVTMRHLNPHVVLFLGDMMDGGRDTMPDAEYEKYYRRFKDIFKVGSVPAYYLPGNHDTGLGSSLEFDDQARQRYVSHFGPLNQRISIANHTVLLIDSLDLVEEDYERKNSGSEYDSWRPQRHGTIEFVKSFAEDKHNDPVILFSHIPLARPKDSSCGSLRERGSINRGYGFGYQNTLGVETSQFLLETTRPLLIFSGDDHDYCEYVHALSPRRESPSSAPLQVREVSVKSFSMAMGIRKPGVQLLSLVDPSTARARLPTHSDAPCFLPDQLGIYLTIYLPLVLFSLLVLLLFNLYAVSGPRRTSAWPVRARSQSPLRRTTSDDAIWVSSSLKTLPARSRLDADVDASTDTESSYDHLDDVDDVPARAPPPSLPSRHPPPTRIPQRHSARGAPWVTRILGVLYSLIATQRESRMNGRTRRAFWRRLGRDILDVAIPPISTFILVAWWMFRS
ncbi:hypothetical protein PLICRDRAFT_103385 [Plicaturopsis crispa FD-325 SS-3]|nr:hypothetical protein PLICRDRAFT_103385 [Plicaturopsis crispa FD-325 SS-3]